MLRHAARIAFWVLAFVLGTTAILAATLALVDGNRLRGPLISLLSRHTGRTIRIDGPLHAHLLSLHPSLIAERVTVGDPPWITIGTMATVGTLTVTFDLPWRGHPFAVRELKLDRAEFHLRRDAQAHANWYWKAPGTLPGKGAPFIYSLSIPDAHVTLDDDRRHLLFDGTLTVNGSPKNARTGGPPATPLRIEAQGHLNGRDVDLSIDGDPLATIDRNKPYHFAFAERSSGSVLTGEGLIARPFDFRVLDATFQAHGADLKDLYFLVGSILPNTGPFQLSGKLTRRYTRFTLSDLVARSGESDLRMTLSSQMFASGQSHVEVDLRSRRLRLSDFGPRAAGRAAGPPGSKPLLLSETEVRVDGIRHTDSVIDFHVEELDAGRLSLHQVAGTLLVYYGNLKVPRLSAAVPGGKIRARGTFDARSASPAASLDVEITGLRIGQLARNNSGLPPPIDGLLAGHVSLTGHGRSIHEFAASANGTVTAVLPDGVMRASLAEMAGINLHALEMTLARDEKETPVRCAVASFQAHQGTLLAQQLMIDTDRMLITGDGAIRFGDETLDLRIQGEPKRLRLIRLSGPLAVQGTLAHPSLSVGKHDRKVELIDPGRAKDVDCPRLLAKARLDGVPISAGAVPSEREP